MATSQVNPEIKENSACAFSYAPFIGFFAALFFFFTDKRRKVKWYAAQSLVLNIIGGILMMVVFFAGPILGLALLGTNIYICYKLFNGAEVKLPFISTLADKLMTA